VTVARQLGIRILTNSRSPASKISRAAGFLAIDNHYDKPVMSEDPKAGELETREHMGRADEAPASEPPTPEGLLGAQALKEYLEAAGLPELESIARTADQLAAVRLAQQIRIAKALERIATALERTQGAVESEDPGDASSSR
jgi:hypothetical protein